MERANTQMQSQYDPNTLPEIHQLQFDLMLEGGRQRFSEMLRVAPKVTPLFAFRI